jgi:hypothetical protein
MTPWYQARASDLPSALVRIVDLLIERDAPRLAAYERYGQLYGGRRRTQAASRRDRLGSIYRPSADLTTARVGEPSEDNMTDTSVPLRLNVVKAAIDTVVSKVGKLRPRPTFLTQRGNWSLKQRAKDMQRFMDGAYHQTDAYEHGLDYFRDAMVYGTGVLLPYHRGTRHGKPRLAVERTPAWEWFTDEDDAEYGNPRCLYRERLVSYERVRQAWPKALPEREYAPHRGDGGGDEVTDYARVVEAWFRPADPTETLPERGTPHGNALEYGRHVVVVEPCNTDGDGVSHAASLAVDEPYPYCEFPPVFFHWSKPTTGFWGDCAVREVDGVQVEVNRLLHDIQVSMRRVGKPMVFVHEDSNLNPSKLSSEAAEHYTYSGQMAPQVHTFNPISPQHMSHLWQLYSKAFEILGSNQLAASATAPPGLESGRALERLSEEHSERFMQVSRAFNAAMGQHMARRLLLQAKLLDTALRDAGRGGFKLRSPEARYSLELEWAKVSVDPDDYITQVFDTSVLPTLPSARAQEVERMQAAGWIEPDEARRLLDFPDLDQSNSLATADYDNLLWQFEQMLEHGRSVLPEPYQNLDRALRLGQASVLRAQRDGVPEDHIDKLRDFIAVVVEMLAPPEPPPAPPGAPPPGGTPTDRRDDVLTTAVPPDALPAPAAGP